MSKDNNWLANVYQKPEDLSLVFLNRPSEWKERDYVQERSILWLGKARVVARVYEADSKRAFRYWVRLPTMHCVCPTCTCGVTLAEGLAKTANQAKDIADIVLSTISWG